MAEPSPGALTCLNAVPHGNAGRAAEMKGCASHGGTWFQAGGPFLLGTIPTAAIYFFTGNQRNRAVVR
jgi:hypothetical protein